MLWNKSNTCRRRKKNDYLLKIIWKTVLTYHVMLSTFSLVSSNDVPCRSMSRHASNDATRPSYADYKCMWHKNTASSFWEHWAICLAFVLISKKYTRTSFVPFGRCALWKVRITWRSWSEWSDTGWAKILCQ